jgi:NitT/TauT family transport system substrate-binding protein
VHLALQSGGLSMGDVNLVNLGPPDAGIALENGSVDASFTIEPLASGFAAQNLTASVSDWHAAGVELAFIAFSTEWLEDNIDTVIRFTAAYLKAAQELDNGGWADPQNQAYVAKYTELPVEALASIGLSESSPDGTFNEADIRLQETYYRDAGQLTYEGEADLTSVFRPDILEAANAFLAANP